MKGLIALDLDGTTTTEISMMPERTQRFLGELHSDGWSFAFVTGRPCSTALRAVGELPFPATLCAQHGALVVTLPDRKVIHRNYLTKLELTTLDRLVEESPLDYCVYGGWELQDAIYIRELGVRKGLDTFLQKRQRESGESIHLLPDYTHLPVDHFPAVKLFGQQDELCVLGERIEEELGWHTPIINDPISPLFLGQATHPTATKGEVVKQLLKDYEQPVPVIAAGDDLNDIPMLRIADVAIVMGGAPEQMHGEGDILAPPAEELGIITALQQAIALMDGGSKCVS